MLDSGGGGYGGTNWSDHSVPYMWAMLAGQQTDPHWQHVSGWRRTSELAIQHVSTLKQYRERLAEAWPPEKSAAAQAYVAQLDYLIDHVQATYDAASTNYTAFSGATSGISTTRYELERIYDEYVENQQVIAQYESDLADYEDKNPVEKLFSSKPSNPVSGSRQEELTWQARSLMYELSGTLIEARTQIKAPPKYAPPGGRGDTQKAGDVSGGGASSVSNPPFIPPIVPAPVPEPPRPTTQTALGGAVPATSALATPAPAGTGTGPTLAGTGPVATLPGPGAMAPTGPTAPLAPGPAPMPPGGIIGGVIPPAAPPRMIAPGGIIGGAPATGLVAPKPGVGGVAAVPGARPMPPGGVIGGAPGVGVAQPGAGTAPRRVNPAGGVIGQPTGGRGGGAASHGGGAGRAPGAIQAVGQGGRAPGAGQTAGTGAGARGAGSGAGTHPVGAGTRGGKRGSDDEPSQRWDPDNPWETDEGVPPVVLPPAEPRRHDPGPAIGSGR
jgi:hypothetical protein